jgi:hypothetical protein
MRPTDRPRSLSSRRKRGRRRVSQTNGYRTRCCSSINPTAWSSRGDASASARQCRRRQRRYRSLCGFRGDRVYVTHAGPCGRSPCDRSGDYFVRSRLPRHGGSGFRVRPFERSDRHGNRNPARHRCRPRLVPLPRSAPHLTDSYESPAGSRASPPPSPPSPRAHHQIAASKKGSGRAVLCFRLLERSLGQVPTFAVAPPRSGHRPLVAARAA